MRILYVEDNLTNQALVERVMRARRHKVVFCEEGEEALQMLADDPGIDLILLDIELAGAISGLEVIKQLRERNDKRPVVAITAYAMMGDRERILEAGCDQYLPKPLVVTDLLTVLDHYEAGTVLPAAAITPKPEPAAEPAAEVAPTPEPAKPAEPVAPAVSPPEPAKPVDPAAQPAPAEKPAVEPAAEVAPKPEPAPAEKPSMEIAADAAPKPEPVPAEKPVAKPAAPAPGSPAVAETPDQVKAAAAAASASRPSPDPTPAPPTAPSPKPASIQTSAGASDKTESDQPAGDTAS